MKRSRVAVLATGAILLLLNAPCVRGQGSQSSAPPPAASAAPQQNVHAPLPPGRVRLGGDVAATRLLHMVPAIYPPIAKTAKIQGTVVLHAVIAKDGTVKELQYISGPPLLMRSAMDAVKQWTYKPYLLDNEPVEVDTTISVRFVLAGTPQPQVPSGQEAPQVAVVIPKLVGPAAGEAEKPIEPQLKADILHLLDVMKAKENMKKMGKTISEPLRPMLIASLPPTLHREQIADVYTAKLLSLFDSPEFTDRIAATYAKYLSDDDVKALITFYSTPAGQHFNSISSELFGELSQLGQRTALENIPAILKELCKEYPELSGKTQFCPASEQPKSSEFLRPRLSPWGKLLPFEWAPLDAIGIHGHAVLSRRILGPIAISADCVLPAAAVPGRAAKG